MTSASEARQRFSMLGWSETSMSRAPERLLSAAAYEWWARVRTTNRGPSRLQDALQVEGETLGAAVVAVGRRVQDGDRALGDAEGLPQPGDVRRGRPLEHVVAGEAVLQRRVRGGEDALPDQGGVAVARQAVVPLVGAAQQLGEVGVTGGRRAVLEVEAHVLERGAVLGLDHDLAGALDQPHGRS